jgi:hypothetical protein
MSTRVLQIGANITRSIVGCWIRFAVSLCGHGFGTLGTSPVPTYCAVGLLQQGVVAVAAAVVMLGAIVEHPCLRLVQRGGGSRHVELDVFCTGGAGALLLTRAAMVSGRASCAEG